MTNSTPAQKKGLSTLAWVGIGCGALLLVAVVAVFGLGVFAVKKGKEVAAQASGSESFEDLVKDLQENPAKKVAETMIALNPELEIVATDDEAGTITFINSRTGERATLDFEEIAQGKLSMTTDEGEFRLDASPDGEAGLTVTGPDGETRFGADTDLGDVPDWVPLYPRSTATRSLYHSSTAAAVTGTLSSETTDPAERVFDNFKERLEDDGWTLRSQSQTTTGERSVGQLVAERDGRTVSVNVVEHDGNTEVTVTYNG